MDIAGLWRNGIICPNSDLKSIDAFLVTIGKFNGKPIVENVLFNIFHTENFVLN